MNSITLPVLAMAPMAEPSPPGFGTFIPLGPNFGPIAWIAPQFKWLMAVGLAVLALGAALSAVLALWKIRSGKQDNVDEGINRFKWALVGFIGSFVLGGVLMGVAGIATVWSKLSN